MDWRTAMGPDGTEGPRRNGSGHLLPEEREELGHRAVLLHADGKTYRQIARELGVNKDTVGPLLKEEYARRRAGRQEARATAIARYESIIRECSRRVKAFADNSSAQNVSGLLAQKRAAQERIDKITGAEAPIKTEHERRVLDLSKLPDKDLDEFARIVEANPEVFGPAFEGGSPG